MKALIQRVSHAKVEVTGEVVGEIAQGILIFLGVEKTDTPELADKLLQKILNYRIFSLKKVRGQVFQRVLHRFWARSCMIVS